VALRLVIEIDGGVHDRDDVVLRDHLRQTGIEALGWTVIRFTNDVALTEPWRIDEAIQDRARCWGCCDPFPVFSALSRRERETASGFTNRNASPADAGSG